MDWFWHVLWICLIVIPVTIIWVTIAIEIIRRHDLSAFQRICWLLVLFIFPLLGAITYLIVSWRSAGARAAHTATPQASAGKPATPSTVDDLTELDRLRRSGALTDAEFEAGKRQILEGQGDRHAAEGVGT